MGKTSRKSKGGGAGSGKSGGGCRYGGVNAMRSTSSNNKSKSDVLNEPPTNSNHSQPEMSANGFEQSLQGLFSMLVGMGQDGCAETDWRNLPAQKLFLACCKYHDVNKVRRLLTTGGMKQHVNDKDGDGCGILHSMAFRNASDEDAEIIKLLVEEGYNVDMLSNKTKETALTVACLYGNYKTVQALVDVGARIDLKDWRGKGPLNTALAKCSHAAKLEEDCCKVLRIIEEANIAMMSALNPDKAEDLREEGDKAFHLGDYHKARDLYTQSIDVLEDPRTYTNRALCCLKIGREIFEAHGEFELKPDGTYRTVYPDAIRHWGYEARSDASFAIEMESNSEKAHYLNVLGYAMSRDFPRAKRHCKEGLTTCPKSKKLKKAMKFFERIHTVDTVSNPFGTQSLEDDAALDAGCEFVCHCSYCFKDQPYVEEDPICCNCTMDMSKYEPGIFAPLIVNFIMGYD
jgi:tetratricopeptide (TPR) repeat protein